MFKRNRNKLGSRNYSNQYFFFKRCKVKTTWGVMKSFTNPLWEGYQIIRKAKEKKVKVKIKNWLKPDSYFWHFSIFFLEFFSLVFFDLKCALWTPFWPWWPQISFCSEKVDIIFFKTPPSHFLLFSLICLLGISAESIQICFGENVWLRRGWEMYNLKKVVT